MIFGVWLASALCVVRAGHAQTSSGDELGDAPAEAEGRIEEASEPSGLTVAFPYDQGRLLASHHGSGALAYVPAKTPRGSRVPLVVFLHGMNAEGHMHPWFGPPFGDLRKVVDPLVASGAVTPFVLAAPTHIRHANAARRMWPDFDLDDFIDKTEAALTDRVQLDRAQVLVVGHSGAGCNPTGGILGSGVVNARPLAIFAVDTCVDERVLASFAPLAEQTRLRFYWQSGWRRPVSELARACEHCELDEIADLPARPNPHLGILPIVLRRLLAEFLPARPPSPASRRPPPSLRSKRQEAQKKIGFDTAKGLRPGCSGERSPSPFAWKTT